MSGAKAPRYTELIESNKKYTKLSKFYSQQNSKYSPIYRLFCIF